MITLEQLEMLAKIYQTSLYPNIVREYFQHIFLECLYQQAEANKLLFKGGTALRIIYGSPRFSEDLDFSIFDLPQRQVAIFVENLFVQTLERLEQRGVQINLNSKSGATTGGYFGSATLSLSGFRPIDIEINISSRKGKKVRGEVETIAGDFTTTFTLIHLPVEMLVEEKVFGALMDRKKPRDFYDLYFMMRKNMISPSQKKKLATIKGTILAGATKIDFRSELGAFLPVNQQSIIRDFAKTLMQELNRQTG